MTSPALAPQSSVSIADPSSIGECRRLALRLAELQGFDAVHIGRAGILATEIATNIQRHAGGGLVLMQILHSVTQPHLEILGLDKGPGMEDIDKCMRDGYSTGGTSGTGLGAVMRLSTQFELYSSPGKGTVVMSRLGQGRAPADALPALELGVISIAVAGEIECGDSWCVAKDGGQISIAVADGLGHGPQAAIASKAVVSAFAAAPFELPAVQLTSMHRAASGSRGAAAACALLRPDAAKIDYAGVGNIYGAVISEGRSRGMVSHNGTLGLQLLRAQQFEYPWPRDSYVVMHSDGLSARWSLSNYPGLIDQHPAIVAAVLYRDFSRARDDATVVVVRYRA